jgi:hypothetical protein
MKPIKLISGLPPSIGGVGRLVNALMNKTDKNIEIIFVKEKGPIRKYFLKRELLKLASEIYNRVVNRFTFITRLFFMKNEVCLCIHPQTIGFPLLFRVIKRNNVYLYVMDNSFFCLTSYNYDPIQKKECFRCLNFSNPPLKQCVPFPVNYKSTKNINYLKKLYELRMEINFLAQNVNQESLLKQHFGGDIKSAVVGMNTDELDTVFPNRGNSFCYDFVYHGGCSLVKGIEYFIDVAENMPSYSFFVPVNKIHCEKLLNQTINNENIYFKECSWDTGLKEVILNSKFTLNTSLWSAPIEGALIKSIYYGQNVFVVQSEYGFENEISLHMSIGRLPAQYENAIEILNEAVLSYKYDEVALLVRRDKLLEFMKNKDIFSIVRNSEF